MPTKSRSSEWRDLPGSRPTVVDSWGVLEWVYGHEPAASLFRSQLERAEAGELELLVSRMTVGEIFYNVRRKQRLGQSAGVLPDFEALPWHVLPVDDALVHDAAELKSQYPISFADCFVAALAQRHEAVVLTGDPDFKRLEAAGVLKVDWIGA